MQSMKIQLKEIQIQLTNIKDQITLKAKSEAKKAERYTRRDNIKVIQMSEDSKLDSNGRKIPQGYDV